ncbi:ubiquitin carboxyl-terminal hydrolase 3-like isoform X1 [Argopecten irradians]|uniref:ubiquitin carboxyl-terminal hydrolase 3-like isoform X1 n=2 Tax=Argopecten irradians TaxID=31199 RepID=UPI0037232EB1
MECPHLEETVHVTAPSIKSENLPPDYFCAGCKTDKSPWICTRCGKIHCGRYVNGHAKEHHEAFTQHAVCMDCDNYSVYCYICDEFVINDTKYGHLDKLRKSLQSLASARNHIRQKVRRRASTDSQENDRHRKKIKKDDRPRSSGLRNLGNTCFMNAVLQSLSNIQQFCGYIKQLPSLEEKISKSRKYHQTRKTRNEEDDVLLIEELRKTLVALWQGTKGAISPESLFCVIWKVVPRFRGYQQQDAHEFMRYLLDRLHTELLTLLPYPNNNSPFIGPKGKSTIVTAIFGGLLQNEVNCLVCGVESKKHDPFLDLSLDIPAQYQTRVAKSKDGEQQVCRLSDCLTSFTEVEELEESELYMCSNCKQRQRSTKKFWIRRLPNVLCLHIKRFRWQSFFRMKLETFIEFPLRELNMNRYVLDNLHETRGSYGGSSQYDLAAVIVHHGSGAGSGHYTAYAMHEGQWYHFNDSTVTPCDPEVVAKCKAYILFYIRREFKLPDCLGINGNGHRQ